MPLPVKPPKLLVEVVINPLSLFHWLIEVVAKLAMVSPVLVVRYNPLFAHWEIDVVAKLAIVSPVEVEINLLSLFHWDIEVVAKLATPRFVEVVRTGTPLCVIVPEAFNVPVIITFPTLVIYKLFCMVPELFVLKDKSPVTPPVVCF